MRDCDRAINIIQDHKPLRNKVKIKLPNRITFNISEQPIIEKLLGDGKVDFFYTVFFVTAFFIY